MIEKDSDHCNAAEDTGDQQPQVHDRRRIDPETGERRQVEEVPLPGGGVLERGAAEAPPAYEIVFDDLVRPFLVMGLAGLGVIPHPDTNQPRVDVSAARHAIEVLELLRRKTEGRLDSSESQMLEQALVELKMQFVEVRRRQQQGE
ncbi:MAG: DUF1844 domain-containing protein [Acidobacteriota bacterium]|nr:DUF1844 domain-containing protein [Acidobacteriota bacterium]MDQ7086848.1 DUF1844 domain-containing protein [Acidobacteriota bacterium]